MTCVCSRNGKSAMALAAIWAITRTSSRSSNPTRCRDEPMRTVPAAVDSTTAEVCRSASPDWVAPVVGVVDLVKYPVWHARGDQDHAEAGQHRHRGAQQRGHLACPRASGVDHGVGGVIGAVGAHARCGRRLRHAMPRPPARAYARRPRPFAPTPATPRPQRWVAPGHRRDSAPRRRSVGSDAVRAAAPAPALWCAPAPLRDAGSGRRPGASAAAPL